MAARTLNVRHADAVREKIKASQLVNRLQNHIDDPDENPLLQSQLKAIETLLDRSIPRLKSVEITGPDGGALRHDVNVVALTSEQAAVIYKDMIDA